jgi:hypothetical protein
VASLLHVARHLFVWLLIATSGCSLALDGPKPNRPKGYAPQCDDNKGLVVADGLLATAVGIGALASFGENEAEAGVVLGLIGVAFTASALRGNGVANECRAEKAQFAQEGVPYAPLDEESIAGRPAGATRGVRPTAPRAPVATMPATTPSDPYVEPRAEPLPAPVRPPAPAPAAIKPARPAPNEPAPADIDPEAWRDFWTEVP